MTNLENLKKLAEGLGADASGAKTNAEAIGVIAEAADEINGKVRTAQSSIPPYAFYGRTDLTEYNFPQIASVSVGAGAFARCANLATVFLPATTAFGDYAFYYCENLTTANIYGAKVLGKSCFTGCKKLAAANAYALEEIMDCCFDGATSLTSFNSSALKKIGYAGFANCSALASVNAPNVVEIGTICFEDCALTKVDFHALERIGFACFTGCASLKTAIFRNTKNAVSLFESDGISNVTDAPFKNTPIASGTGYIYVPKALIEKYKTAEHWNVYANQYRALEDYTVDGTTTGALDESKI